MLDDHAKRFAINKPAVDDPAVNGRSGGEAPTGLRPGMPTSDGIPVLPPAGRLASAPPDLPFTAGDRSRRRFRPSAVLATLAVSLACSGVQANPPKPAAAAALPQTFYNAPSMPATKRSYETLLAQQEYAREQTCRFNKILRGDTRRPQIALTFDDGPHPVYTLQLLNILRRMHTPATFFVVGEQVEKNPALVRLEVAEGNEVGDHTYDHINLTVVPPELVGYEVDRCNAAISQATGAPVRFFRPPGGEYNGSVVREISPHGFITTLWTADPGDFSKPAPALILKRTLAHLGNGAIILLHDGIPETLQALPGIITAARQRGYQFVTLSQLAHAR